LSYSSVTRDLFRSNQSYQAKAGLVDDIGKANKLFVIAQMNFTMICAWHCF